MDILYLLIPLSSLLVLALLVLFAWALHGGQFDDLEREGERILGGGASPALDADQCPPRDGAEQSGPNERRRAEESR
jgi:cbb3-type cytochrome oxidase maturation protein